MTGDHYFTAEPSVREKLRSVEFSAGGRDFTLTSATGVFSGDRLDPGTAVLLRKAPLPTVDGPLLDLGCGYGPITCYLATSTTSMVYAVDVNSRALELTRANAAAVGAAARVITARPDEVPDDLRFAEIWSNPPIRIGKPELHALLDRWLPRLAPGGTAWLVVARYLGGDSLAARLAGQGWIVAKHASQKGYRVLRVDNPVA